MEQFQKNHTICFGEVWKNTLENAIIKNERKKGKSGGSRIPSMSIGGAAMKVIINTKVAINKIGIIKIPNHPM